MPWLEIIKLLLPIIIEIIGNKNKSMGELSACWNSPQGRIEFVAQVCKEGTAAGLIRKDQQLDVILAFAQVADNPLAPLFIEKLAELAALKNE